MDDGHTDTVKTQKRTDFVNMIENNQLNENKLDKCADLCKFLEL